MATTHADGSGRAARPARARARPPRGRRPAAGRPRRPPDRRVRGPRPRRARLTGVVAPVADVESVVGELVARVAGFGPLQPFLDDPTGRGGLDQRPEPGLRRAPRPARADQPGAHQGPGRRAGRADAQELRAADRPEPAVRRRDAARGAPAARRARGHQPRVLGGQHPQVRPPGVLARRPRRARQPEPASGGVPRRVGARRAQHPGRRRDPGRQDHLPQLPGRLDPGRRAGGERRGGLRAAVPAPGLGGPADAADAGSRAPARSGCATWSRRACGCDRAG